MNRRKNFIFLLVFLLTAVQLITAAEMEPACKEANAGKASLTAKEAWDMALDRARKWSSDVTLFDFATMDPGLDQQGRATQWDVKFFSPGKQAVDLISIEDGRISCYAHQGSGGRTVPWDDEVIFDSKRLLDVAEAAGGNKYSSKKGIKISLDLECGVTQDVAGKPLWRLNYEPSEGKTFTVIMDAKTLKVNYASE